MERVPDVPVMRADLADRSRRLALSAEALSRASRSSVQPPGPVLLGEIERLVVQARRVHALLESEPEGL